MASSTSSPSVTGTVGVRRSLLDLQKDYEAGNRLALETLMRAWRWVKALPPTDPNSFFTLGGYHGEPFRGPGATDPAWWGGYCQHATVLFPVWHRAYLHRVEKALQSAPGCAGVMLPFWDECSSESQEFGIPWALTVEKFMLDDEPIDNPLRSFILPVAITDEIPNDDPNYSKYAGYETVRYPLSGLVGTPEEQAATAAHNAKFPNYDENVGYLNRNITAWLTTSMSLPQPTGGPITVGMVYQAFRSCLTAPNYTLFSNTTSQGNWNNNNPHQLVTALESPHNFMHLAVGGYDVPTGPNAFNASPIPGANGDMGENDTAGLDPIFFFHHCFIDYVFWTWQRRNGFTDQFEIEAGDPGTIYAAPNNQPPADADPDAPLTMSTPLYPFLKDDGTPYTASDCVNIQSQLGYGYGNGSLDIYAQADGGKALTAEAPGTAETQGGRTAHVSGIDRSKIRGSFLVAAYADIDGEQTLVGVEPVLSRWSTEGCANCQTHLRVSADFRVPEDAAGGVHVEVHTRDGVIGARRPEESAGILPPMLRGAPQQAPFTVEIR